MLLDPVSMSRAESRLDPAGHALDPNVFQRVEFAMEDLRVAMDAAANLAAARWPVDLVR
ncbi:MAG: hypothetical protein WED09_08000 [Homoserinimonas sp.]